MPLVIAVREVEPRDAHTGVQELTDGFLVPARGAHGAHDFGLALGRLRREDLLEGNSRGAEGDRLVILLHGELRKLGSGHGVLRYLPLVDSGRVQDAVGWDGVDGVGRAGDPADDHNLGAGMAQVVLQRKEERTRGPVRLRLRVRGFRNLERVLAVRGVRVPRDVVQ